MPIFLTLFWRFTDPRKDEGMFDDLKQSKIRNLTIFEILAVLIALLVYVFYPSFNLDLRQTFVNLGLIIFFTGILFSVWAKVTMGVYWNQPIVHDKKRQNKIVTSGPFKFSRNPIYVGLFIMFTGFFMALKSPLIITLVVLGYVLHTGVMKEEKNLEKLFGKEYMEYKKQTPRYLLF